MEFDNIDSDMDLDDLVQKSAVDKLKKRLLKKRNKKIKKIESPYNTKFNEYTEIEMKALRISKQDPIEHDSFEEGDEKAFIFKYMWDPYTGNRLEEDPIGPLYFNPINLIFYWYIHRLDNLWISESDETDGYWSGVPGDLFGAGEECYIKGRGFMKDKYIFRLPITLCYIPEKIGYTQAVTMGPKLTDSEIEDIYEKAKKYWEREYKIRFGKKLPDIIKVKKFYDLAIKKNPAGEDATDEENYAENKKGVEYLLKMA